MISWLPNSLFGTVPNDQVIVLCVLGITFFAFLWGRWRYDVVALGSLLTLVLLGIVPMDDAFSGFSHRAVVTVAAVLVLSYALGNTGVTYHLSNHLSRFSKTPSLLILTLSGLVVFFSAFMNDVGALALIMPVALQVSQRYKIPASALLMPMAFASLLGGTLTLIGTPPNMIIAQYRESIGMGAYKMFDFLPVGIVVATVGLLYISFIGWRFLPVRQTEENSNLFETDDYLLELKIPENNKFIKKTIGELEAIVEHKIRVATLLRGARRILSPNAEETLKAGDILLVEGQPEELKQLELLSGLTISTNPRDKERMDDEIEFLEVVINPGARIAGHQLADLQLRERYHINILGVSRHGEKIHQRFSRLVLKTGDVLLIQGYKKELPETLNQLGCLPLAERNVRLKPSAKLWPTVTIFMISILLVATQILPAHIAFPLAIFALVSSKLLSLREAYHSIEGPLIVLLGCFITVGAAVEKTGATGLIVGQIVSLLDEMPAILVLGSVMLATMIITDIINSSATAVIMAPIAVGIATQFGHNIDPYLMAVAIGCSCSFNTPIGHHSNTLVMGPGGYYFGDYWRMGVMLDLLILITTVPTLAYVWSL